jgi:hypothetical protein
MIPLFSGFFLMFNQPPIRIYLELRDEHSGEPRREHHSRFYRSCPHQIQHQFRLRYLSRAFVRTDFSVARIIIAPVPIHRCRFAPSLCGEMLDATFNPVARAIGFHWIDRVVVCRLRLEAVDAYTENSFSMVRVQPDRRFRCLPKVLWIRSVMHYSVMQGWSTGVVGGPPNDCQVGISPFNFWPLDDPYARSFFGVGTSCATAGVT